MNELYVCGFKLTMYNGRKTLAPVYGNFCPKCNASSIDIWAYDGGLVTCIKCNHVFQIQDVKDKIKKAYDNYQNSTPKGSL